MRVKVVVLGGEVADYRQSYYPESHSSDAASYGTYIKIPDEWRRRQQELTPLRTIFNYILPLLVLGSVGVTILTIFLKNLRSETARSVPWKRLSMWALWGLATFYVSFLLGSLGRRAKCLRTAIPVKTMYGVLGITALLGGPFNFALLAVTFGVAWYFARRAFDGEDLPAWTGMPATYYRDALFIGLGGTAAILGLRTLVVTVFGSIGQPPIAPWTLLSVQTLTPCCPVQRSSPGWSITACFLQE